MKLKSLLFSSLMLLGGVFSSNQVWALEQDGSGVYQIGTAQDLLEFAGVVNGGTTDANAVLTADIDLTGKTWTPIGNSSNKYVGIFDGQYHVINNLKYNDENGEKIGIFGVVNGGCVIKNLIAGSGNEIRGKKMLGGIVGCSDGSGWVTLENVGHEGYVYGTAENCSAIIGVVMNGGPATDIKNCYNTGNIRGGWDSAIITGWFGGHESVKLNGFYNSGTLENGINGTDYLWRNNQGIKVSSYYNTINNSQGATKVTSDQLESGEVAYLLNESKDAGVWHQTIGTDNHPTFGSSHGLIYANDHDSKEGTSTTYSNISGAHSWNDWGFCSLLACNECKSDFMTPVNGSYMIGSEQQLNWFAHRVNNGGEDEKKWNACLTADIDFSGQSAMIGEPGHPYGGEFNGQGHTVTVSYSASSSAGEDDGELGLFRRVNGGTVKNLKVAGTINTVNKLAGGIVSSIWEKGTIENCISAVTITDEQSGDGTHGGICARVKNRDNLVTIKNCAFVGTINAPNRTGSGGIMGWPDNGGENVKFINCYVSGTLNLKTGDNNDVIVRSSGVATNCFFIGNSSMNNSRKATSKANVAALMSEGGLNPGWWMSGSDSYPRPFATTADFSPVAGVYSISDAADLFTFASLFDCGKNESGNANLTADIDFDDAPNFPGIGSITHVYGGILNGQGHTISNLTMNYSREGVGLVNRATAGFQIKNLTIASSCSFTGSKAVGAFVGGAWNNSGVITFLNCGNEGTVTSTGQNAGGILGCNFNGNIAIHMTNCYNTGTIDSDSEGGALSGWVSANAQIYNCYNCGTLTNCDGFMRGNDSGTIDHCWSTSNATEGGFSLAADNDLSYDTDLQNGTVFAALHDYTDNSVDGSVWQMEFSGTPHPVLYNADMVMKEEFPNRPKAGRTGDVTLNRTIKKDGWNTFCVPFDMNNTQITTYFGASAKVAMLDETKKADDNVLHFKTLKSVDNIEAGQAYLVYPDIAADFSQKDITNVTIEDVDPEDVSLNQAGFAFTGVFEPTALTANEDYIVAFGQKVVKTSGGSLNGFRAYFKPIVAGARATSFVIDDEEVTGIITLEGEVIVDEPVYNLNGVRVAQPTSGMYVKNGKKYIQR